jgi:hypothetical protein
MKIGLYANKSPRAILEHTKEVTLGVTIDTEGIMVEDVLHDVPSKLPVINTSVGAKVITSMGENRELFYKELGFVSQAPDSFLYGFLSPDSVSDFMEMQISGKFMTGDVGVDIGFVQGTGVPCSKEVYAAFPKLEGLVDALHVLEYSGEVVIGVTRDFQLCSLTLGHCTGAWSLFTELAQQSPQETLEFCFGKRPSCQLHSDRIAVCTMLSYSPYPYIDTEPFSVLAPRIAERHLYRFNVGNSELAYAAASGCAVFEARRRIRRTTDNCSNYNATLQYRIDYGVRADFVFCQDSYKAFGGRSK